MLDQHRRALATAYAAVSIVARPPAVAAALRTPDPPCEACRLTPSRDRGRARRGWHWRPGALLAGRRAVASNWRRLRRSVQDVRGERQRCAALRQVVRSWGPRSLPCGSPARGRSVPTPPSSTWMLESHFRLAEAGRVEGKCRRPVLRPGSWPSGLDSASSGDAVSQDSLRKLTTYFGERAIARMEFLASAIDGPVRAPFVQRRACCCARAQRRRHWRQAPPSDGKTADHPLRACRSSFWRLTRASGFGRRWTTSPGLPATGS